MDNNFSALCKEIDDPDARDAIMEFKEEMKVM